jgi:glycerol-3-phosphate dehydrogenase
LNASGAWSDEVAAGLKPGLSQKVLKLKGAQLVLKLPEELKDWGMMAINRAKEPIYCVPMRGLHIVGLNRTPYQREADSVVAERDEVNWLLGELNYLMPKLNMTRDDIQFTMAGLQPITFDPKELHGSRSIKIHDLAADGLENILTLTGGPIMTYRQVGRDLAKAVARRITPSNSARTINFNASDRTRAILASQTRPAAGQIPADLLHQIAVHEQPANLADILFRRTGQAWNPGQARDLARQTAEKVAKPLGWDAARITHEVAVFEDYLDQKFSDHHS